MADVDKDNTRARPADCTEVRAALLRLLELLAERVVEGIARSPDQPEEEVPTRP